jgi:hypothetical protein
MKPEHSYWQENETFVVARNASQMENNRFIRCR